MFTNQFHYAMVMISFKIIMCFHKRLDIWPISISINCQIWFWFIFESHIVRAIFIESVALPFQRKQRAQEPCAAYEIFSFKMAHNVSLAFHWAQKNTRPGLTSMEWERQQLIKDHDKKKCTWKCLLHNHFKVQIKLTQLRGSRPSMWQDPKLI